MYKILIITLLALGCTTFPASAQTPGPTTSSPTVSPATTISDSKNNDSLTEKINDLKDKIASRVAELNLVEKRGIMGSVIERTDTQIIIKDIAGISRSIDVDEITKFASPGKTNFGISDIEKDDVVGAVGIYNKQSKRILARFVDVINLPIVINGVVTKTDDDEFTITITSIDKKNYIVDVEKITKTSEYTKENGIEKSGFTDIRIGERSIVTGYLDNDEADRITATRILLFPEYPKDPRINVSITPEPTEDETTPTPTARSRITPAPTRRPTP